MRHSEYLDRLGWLSMKGPIRLRLTRAASTVLVLGGTMFALLKGSGCHDSDCHYGDGPWLPANRGDKCDAPPEISVNALDSCQAYRCYGGTWNQLIHLGCAEFMLEFHGSDVSCMPLCLADLKPDVAGLDYSCVFGLWGPTTPGETPISLPPPCVVGPDGWVLPEGAMTCIGGRSSLNSGRFDALPTQCMDEGLNLGVQIVGEPLPMDYELLVACQWNLEPPTSCPDVSKSVFGPAPEEWCSSD
jgi:hypothetical protein